MSYCWLIKIQTEEVTNVFKRKMDWVCWEDYWVWLQTLVSRYWNMSKKGLNWWTMSLVETWSLDLRRRHQGSLSAFVDAWAACLVCSKQHDIWKCNQFKGFIYEEKGKIVQNGELVNKCLVKGGPKSEFHGSKKLGCGGNHHTLMQSLTVETVTEMLLVRIAILAQPLPLLINIHNQVNWLLGLTMLLGPVMAMELL